MKNNSTWRFVFVLQFLLSYSVFAGDLPPRLIRVRILNSQQKIVLSGSSIEIGAKNSNYQNISLSSVNTVEIEQVLLNGKRVWQLNKRNQKVEFLSSSQILIKGQNLFVNGLQVHANFYLAHHGLFIDVIALVPIEEYILGVVATEMPKDWPVEALKAQAVAARSYSYAVIKERQHLNFDVQNATSDQVFQFIDKTRHHVKFQKVISAVEQTTGEYLSLNHNLSPAKTFYHSDCGGATVSAKSVWGRSVTDLGTAKDQFCPQNPKAKWEYFIEQAELDQLLNGKINQLKYTKYEDQERVSEIEVIRQNKKVILSGQQFRKLIGFEKIKSTQFQIEKIGTKYIFKGLGFGHGVGMCQWGSYKLAVSGQNYRQILNHYYPQARLNVRKSLIREL